MRNSTLTALCAAMIWCAPSARASAQYVEAQASVAVDAQLDTQTRQLAFWINVYNGYTQYFLKADPGPYLDNRSAYFGAEQIHIAGDHVSLEDIEI